MSRAIATTARLFGHGHPHHRRAVVVFVLVAGIVLGVVGLRGRGKALAQVAPPADRQPGLAPAPVPQSGKYEFLVPNIAYFYFAQDGSAVIQYPSRPSLVLPPAEAEGIRRLAQQPPRPLGPQRIGQRYFINITKVEYWQNNDAGGATAHFDSSPSLDLTAEEVAQLRQAARHLMQTMAEGPEPVGPEIAPPPPSPARSPSPAPPPPPSPRNSPVRPADGP
jgi:hypothetical protein